MTRRASIRWRRFMVGCVIASCATLAACHSVSEPAATGPTLGVEPTAIVLPAGDSSAVTVVSTRDGTVSWRSSNTAVATIDSSVIVGQAAKVRAKGLGTAVLNATIKLDGISQSFTASVPVRVGGG